jgi:omega-6 fatty acid desaturase (delta-12 desaturase)
MSDRNLSDTQPIAPDAPMPHRKFIRQWLIPLAERTHWHAFALLTLDYVLFAALIAGAVVLEAWWAQTLCALAAGFVIGRLFIIGHDACHQSLTPNRKLNHIIGRLAFLPSLTPYSLWEVGHNVVHHGYTNLKGADFVWAPLSRDEYQALPARARLMQRIYRSGWAPGLYYLVEMWWKRMFWPNKSQMPTRRAVFFKDNALVSAFGVLWIAALIGAALWLDRSVVGTVLMGFVLPFLFWNSMIGFVVYGHHTHVKVTWHDDKRAWSSAAPFVSTTVHLTFPFKIGGLMHHIMEHTAHHVDMSVPLYRLKQAQQKLETMLPERIVVQQFSWRWYFETARKCKLYDYSRQAWTDFRGHVTAFSASGTLAAPQPPSSSSVA